LYRGISDFKKGYQPRTKIVNYEKAYLITDCHTILTRWRNHFSRLFSVRVYAIIDVRQIAEPPVPEPSAFAFEMAIEI